MLNNLSILLTASVIGGYITVAVLALIVIIVLIRNVIIVPQAHVFVLERLGSYKETWQTGLHFKVPFIDKISRRISMKEIVADFDPQYVITKDNVTMQIDTVLFYQVVDPVLYSYGIEDPINAIDNLSSTTLRNLIGDLELDETLTSRDTVNNQMRILLDEATDPWGIKVNRVELKNIVPPQDIQSAMERQMKAEREKRESILIAEGKKESQIRIAEGEKEAAILRADAKREQTIREADGEAQAILRIQKARAEGLAMIKDVQADQAVISLRGLEAMEKVADGRATKILIPSELQGLATAGLTLKESMQDSEKTVRASDTER